MKKLLPVGYLVMALLAMYQLLTDIASQHKPAAAATNEYPQIVRLDPRFDALVPKDAVVEKLADGFSWVEGPVWNRAEKFLLFSDIPNNAVMKWKEGEGISLFLKPSGYSGKEPFTGREPGSNGLTFDPKGRLVLCQHGDRRIARLEADGSKTTLVDRYQGKRINSPNDAILKSNGDMYFTDPPFGLPGAFDDPGKELDFQGVYRLSTDGKLTLLTKDLQAPNGIAFSPDEKILYLSDSGLRRWMAFDVKDDGAIANGRVLLDGTALGKDKPGAPDGMKVDKAGNIFSAAPGGIYVISPDGDLLGMFDFNQPTGNCAFGEDGSTLFVTANTAIYRVQLNTEGAGF
jgi:gluconolactonase